MLQNVPNHEIIKRYREGERDFRKIMCVGTDFVNLDLSDIDFSGSDLGFSGFQGANFTNAKFSNCNIVWSNFERANLTNANFEKAKLNWSSLNKAIFRNTRMVKTDLSWCILFDTNRGEVDLTDAITATSAWHIGEVSQLGIMLVKENLEKLKSLIPYDLWLEIKFKIEHTSEGMKKHHVNEKSMSSYLDQLKGRYSAEDQKVLQTMGLEAYAGLRHAEYGMKKQEESKPAYGGPRQKEEKKKMPWER